MTYGILYIYKYKHTQPKIKYKDNIGTDYFFDIIKYFSDTSVILELKCLEEDNLYENFANAISFLQAIYIQQDLLEELLFIFSCKSNKGVLKKDLNYSLNRDIRNELVGHPIRKQTHDSPDNKLRLSSSAIFSNDQYSSNISYIRYSKQDNFVGSHIKIKREQILARHQQFLDNYFNEIFKKIHRILKEFKPVLTKLFPTIDKAPLSNLLNRLNDIYSHSFEEYYYLYKPCYILKLEENKAKHVRYEIALSGFYFSIKSSVLEEIKSINQTLGINDEMSIIKKTDYKGNKFSDGNNFSYELSKLAQKDRFVFDVLKSRCLNSKTIMDELQFMYENWDNEFEYYSAYEYLSYLLQRRS